MADKVILSGTLLKWKSLFKWSPRQLVLTTETLTCIMIQSNGNVVEECVHVHSIDIQSTSNWYFNVLLTGQRVLYFKVTSMEDKCRWMTAIKDVKETIVHSGSLKKWTNMIKGWQPRYFILYNDRLCYYLSNSTLTERRGTIFLANIHISRSSTKKGFDIAGSSVTWHLRTPIQSEENLWLSMIRSLSDQRRSSSDMSIAPSSVLSSLQDIPSTCSTDVCPQSSDPYGSPSSSIIDEDNDMETNYKKDLECNICLDLLRDPTSLVCGHSFCRNCLTDLWGADRNRFVCPTCRQTISTIPSVNIAMQNLISVLYQDEVNNEPPQRSQYSEAFDNHFRGSTSLDQTGVNGLQSHAPTTNMEFEFIKRGMWFIFVIWLLGKMLSSFLFDKGFVPNDVPITDDLESDGPNDSNTSNSTLFRLLDSRNTVIFLIVGMLECPRLLGLYILLFWYHSVFYPVVEIISKFYNQVPGVKLHIKVVLWGSLVPYIWLLPVFYHENQLILVVVCFALSALELWRVVLGSRQLINILDSNTYLLSMVKQTCVMSLVKLVFARLVSFLPWSWLPDVLYNCVILCLSAGFISRSIFTVRHLVERTRNFTFNVPSGVGVRSF